MEILDTSHDLAWPAWAMEAGRDRFGGWADCSISGVRQRFRFIDPGTFRMGSSVAEMDRERSPWGKETRHTVRISKGFWLADTACTQRLWQAVMHYNPSEFVGEQRPVERVNWFDIQEFLSRAGNGEVGHCGALRLPTEAEWEYAARGGTETSFSFGHSISADQANFNGEQPYFHGTTGPYRKETVNVEAFGCNAWGLYQMHGNVWEWCCDTYREDLGDDSVIDPFNDGDDQATRVVRGGGWSCPGHGARSAFRSYDKPSDRFNNLGFRLAWPQP
jgi:formylglycine-generating enzyme required for sulfatase activity